MNALEQQQQSHVTRPALGEIIEQINNQHPQQQPAGPARTAPAPAAPGKIIQSPRRRNQLCFNPRAVVCFSFSLDRSRDGRVSGRIRRSRTAQIDDTSGRIGPIPLQALPQHQSRHLKPANCAPTTTTNQINPQIDVVLFSIIVA